MICERKTRERTNISLTSYLNLGNSKLWYFEISRSYKEAFLLKNVILDFCITSLLILYPIHRASTWSETTHFSNPDLDFQPLLLQKVLYGYPRSLEVDEWYFYSKFRVEAHDIFLLLAKSHLYLVLILLLITEFISAFASFFFCGISV